MSLYYLFPILQFIITTSISSTSASNDPPLLRSDSIAIQLGSTDYGNLVHLIPSSVLYPESVKDIIHLVKSSTDRPGDPAFTVAARGRGHSLRGQAMTRDGVVVNMISLGRNSSSGDPVGIRVFRDRSLGFYADVGGEQLWIDVLRATLAEGLSPVSWTDYLYLSVGGTLSNAGISGQSFRHGPQISNVLELDVVTGKGEFVTCSKEKNQELFFGVLGGLGQFGIITRARIILAKAPTRVKWAVLLYSNFSTFTTDQEHLTSVSSNNTNAPNYVEGFLVTNESLTLQWRASFLTPSNQSDIEALLKKQGIIYAIEVAKYYDNQTAIVIDGEFQDLLNKLNYIPNFIFTKDATYFDFLHRVGNLDNLPGPTLSHPWLDLFIPKSRIFDLNRGVFTTLLPKLNEPFGIFIFYPHNRNKWDPRMSAVTPDEDVFYALDLLHFSLPENVQIYEDFNDAVLQFCKENGIQVKKYLPYYVSKQEWMEHYGPKWEVMMQRKSMFDPKRILSPGQTISNYL